MKRVYNILLVDDEIEIRSRIASKINENIGFNIVGNAGNGYDALELLEEKDVDVVLTDIKMPFIDGLELTKVIKRDYPMIKVAFITGYDDFDYAKEAIDLGVKRYMTKPITSKEINSFLVQLKADLDLQYSQMQDILIMREKYDELLPIIGDSYLSSLLYRDHISIQDEEKLGLYGINVMEHEKFVSCLIKIEEQSQKSLKETEELRVNANEIIKQVFAATKFKHSLIIADGVVFVFSVDDLSKDDVDDLLNQVVHSTKEYIDTAVSIGVSNVFDDFKLFPSAFQEAKKALRYSNHYGFAQIVYVDELYDNKVRQSFLSMKDISRFSRTLQYGTTRELSSMIFQLKERIESKDEVFVMQYAVIDLASLIITLAEQAGVFIKDIIEEDIVKTLNQKVRLTEMVDYTYSVVLQIKAQDTRKQLSHSERLIQDILGYIESDYHNDSLSLEYLSDKYNVSGSHLSMLFKKNAGITFSRYLINLRMKKAKELLLKSDLKIADISVKVGYKDVYYFSHSFKRVVGVSPREYRNNEVVS